MIEKKITLYDYEYHLKIDDEKNITYANFNIRGKLPEQMTEEEIKIGHIWTQEIFSGKWNWLIFTKDYISLSEFNMAIYLRDIEYDGAIRWGYGEIVGGQKEVCTHCDDPECEWDCMEALEWASDRDIDCQESNNEELEGNRNFNYAVHGIESLVLGLACAGFDVTSNIFKEGLRAAFEGCANNI